MSKLWQKSGSSKLHPAIEAYTVGNDYVLDQSLLPYDIKASLAHAKMLKKIGILNAAELKKLDLSLAAILKQWNQGKFKISLEDEDMHTAIENALVKKLGQLGKKIHTGRSRNDQILVVMHLFMKDSILDTMSAAELLIKKIAAWSKKHGKTVMPGYTHMQQAMPLKISDWIGAHSAAIKDDLIVLKAALQLVDQNPLGSAAGFSVPVLKLDRNFTTRLLGFKKTMNPPLYCQNSRAKIASTTVGAFAQLMLSLGKFANDMLLFTTKEFSFFKVNDEICTGSSIMPQKKNLDVLEILRANVSVVLSHEFRLKQLGLPLISGYHRDLQLSKASVMESFQITWDSLNVLPIVLANISPDKERISEAMSDGIFATEKVYLLVKQGLSFRDAYKKVKQDIKSS